MCQMKQTHCPKPKNQEPLEVLTASILQKIVHLGSMQENSNKSARLKYLVDFPNLNESTVRNFKPAYKEKVKLQKDQQLPQLITALPCSARGHHLF